MRHIHKYIVSRHLATRGNNKILCTPPSHISSSEEILSRLNRRRLVQLRTNKSPFLISYLHKVDAKSHPSHIINCTHIRSTLSPARLIALLVSWSEKLADGPQAGRTPPPPLERVIGVGR